MKTPARKSAAAKASPEKGKKPRTMDATSPLKGTKSPRSINTPNTRASKGSISVEKSAKVAAPFTVDENRSSSKTRGWCSSFACLVCQVVCFLLKSSSFYCIACIHESICALSRRNFNNCECIVSSMHFMQVYVLFLAQELCISIFYCIACIHESKCALSRTQSQENFQLLWMYCFIYAVCTLSVFLYPYKHTL